MGDTLKMGRYPMTVLTDDDQIRDDGGFTNPNLHRRVDTSFIYDDDAHKEVLPRDHLIGVINTDSCRTTTYFTHDEESTTSEVP